ncbi:unnamed protein product [Caenorhabditis sp. 36 PRJEB53466]|nr:unnamed protein product [Caenorhabditis sp. 36 PRJEB53466]
MNSSCSTTFTYWDSVQFQATYSHILILITLPINLFGGYCIIKKTPRNRKTARWYILHLHAWTILTDLLIGGLLTPYMFFPLLVGIPAGVLSWLSVPVWIQVFFAQVGLGGLATSIVMLFENRHNTLVRGKFKIEAEWIRYTFYALNGIYSLLFLLPCYFRIPDPTWAKPILLEILPCPHPSYFQDNVFVFSMDISSVTGTAGFYLMFMLFETFALCIHSSYFLLSLKTHMSRATRKLQQKFFIDMIWQVSIPVGVIVLPMLYCFYSIVQQQYNQMYNNIAVICISLHGMSSTLTLIWLNPTYCQFALSALTCMKYKSRTLVRSIMNKHFAQFESTSLSLSHSNSRMVLPVIVRESAKSDYRIVFRNTSIFVVAVKIINPNASLRLDRHECFLLANKYTFINVLDTPAKADVKKTPLKPVLVYCRAMYPFNRKNIRHWIENHVTDKPQHLVQTLNFAIDDSEFSAKTVIVDLPGKSTMIESTGYAIKMNNSKMLLRTFLENDTSSAVPMEAKSVLKCLPRVAKPDNRNTAKPVPKVPIENEDACFIIPLFKALCNPTTKVETV